MFKKYQFRFIFLLTLLLTVLLVHPSFRGVSATLPSELRGVWITNVDSQVLFSSLRTTAVLERLKQLHFNTIYPTVWQGGYTLYPSSVAENSFGIKIDPTPGLQNRDILEEFVQQGHARNLTIIPWFEFGFMAPAKSELVAQHPDWVTRRQDGTIVQTQGVYDRVWLNPFYPEVQQFLLDLVLEIVSNYDVDGIQFDDHFGLPSDFGYDDYTLNLYRQDTGNTSAPRQVQDPDWVQWRADKISEFVAALFKEVKAIKPNCIISLSPNPYKFALFAYLQDWFKWQQQGWIEELIVQIYRPDLDRFITELEQPELQQAKDNIPVAIGILTGLKNRPNSIKMITKQVKTARQQGFAGISFFFYESLWKWATEPIYQREAQIQQLFPHSVPRTTPL